MLPDYPSVSVAAGQERAQMKKVCTVIAAAILIVFLGAYAQARMTCVDFAKEAAWMAKQRIRGKPIEHTRKAVVAGTPWSAGRVDKDGELALLNDIYSGMPMQPQAAHDLVLAVCQKPRQSSRQPHQVVIGAKPANEADRWHGISASPSPTS
jgi:hypothetical protein